MLALIDADIVAYRCAAAAENDDEGIAKYYAEQLLDEILSGAKADKYSLFLTGKGNFRYTIYPEYKANRSDVPRPKHLPYLREFLQTLGASVSAGCEADDMLGVAQCTSTEPTVIVSLDKDLLTIPGNHYSWEIRGTSRGTKWVKEAIARNVTEYDANHWFYTQCITGDTADNIKGIQGRGKAFAKNLLAEVTTEQEMFDAVREAYDHDEEFLMNARVLHIWRKDKDDYQEHYNRLSGSGS